MSKKERFFGLHFDFHADDETEIGIRTDPADIQWYIDTVKPDFIQCDSKGHPGISSYPTKIGHPAKGLKCDNLKIWSDTAKKNNIPLYVHHSGLYDVSYTKAHPEMAECDKEGNPTDYVSLFGRYAEDYLIPSINEMIDMYDIDGVWMDGECWAVHRDYSPLAKEHMPNGFSDDVMRKAFEEYMKKCADAFHEHKPDFKYISNWAYSSYMPEKPIEGVLDSLSGDYPPTDSIYAARYEGRCLAAQNMPWDLMCWSRMREWLNPYFSSLKTEQQLKQEAAAVLMLGGGFQLYITQNRDGSARRLEYKPLAGLSDFVHKRKMLFKKKTLAQVGIYYSARSRYENSEIYNAAGATEPLIGIINSVLSAQYTANVVLEYQYEEFSHYDIMVVPEWNDMSDEEIRRLADYARNGGKLVVSGGELCIRFGKELGYEFERVMPDKKNTAYTDQEASDDSFIRYQLKDDDGGMEQINGEFANLGDGEEYLYYNNDLRDSAIPAYRICETGKGSTAFIPFDLGENYFKIRTQKKMHFIQKILNKLAAPEIEINRTNIDISVLGNVDGIYINLLNMYQNRYDVKFDIFDEVPPIYDIELRVKGKFSHVSMPLGEEFTYEIKENYVQINLKKLEIHSIIELK